MKCFGSSILAVLLAVVGARGQTVQYAAGNFTWGTDVVWASSSGGSYTQAWSHGNDAVFEGGAGIVSLAAGGVVARNLYFTNTTGYIIQNNILTLDGSRPTITVGLGLSAAISSVITGNVGLTKSGSGTLTLFGTNTYSGATTINGGTLRLCSLTASAPLHYTFASGAAVNSGTQSVTTTISGGPTFSATGGPRAGLGYVSFNGTGQYIDIVPNSGNLPNLSGNSPNTYTIALWIKTSTPGSAFLFKGNPSWSSGDETFFLTDITGNNPGGTHTGTHVGGVQHSGGFIGGISNVADGNWNFISLVRTNGTTYFYVNGVADGTATSMSIAENSTQQIRIGVGGSGQGDGQVNFNGFISDISVFDRALSAAEIPTLMQRGVILPTNTTLFIVSGAKAALDFSGTNTIKYLYLNGSSQVAGTYGASALGGPGYFIGSGVLNVASTPPSGMVILIR